MVWIRCNRNNIILNAYHRIVAVELNVGVSVDRVGAAPVYTSEFLVVVICVHLMGRPGNNRQVKQKKHRKIARRQKKTTGRKQGREKPPPEKTFTGKNPGEFWMELQARRARISNQISGASSVGALGIYTQGC